MDITSPLIIVGISMAFTEIGLLLLLAQTVDGLHFMEDILLSLTP